MKNYLLVNRALAAEKNVNLIEMLRGCSKRNGTTFRQSNPDGQPTVNRQSRLMSHRGYLKNLAMIFAVLVMSIANIGMAWGTVVSFSATNLNAPEGRTIGSIALSTSTMAYDNSNGLKAGSASKAFTLTASGGATISQVLITSTAAKRYTAGNITNCTSCTREGNVYTCTISPATSSVTCTNSGGGLNITRIDVTYSGGTSTKRIYMKCGDSWCSSTPRFFAHTWGSADNDLELYAVDGCDPAVYYADIPSGNTSVVFTRQNSSSTGILWSGSNFWNKSEDITIDTNNLFTCTGWNNGVTGTFSGSVAALSVTYNANGATGSAPTDANSYGYGATVTVQGKNTLTKADNMFIGWNTEDDGTGTWYAPGETFTIECANVTLYAQWATELDLKYVWKVTGKFCDDQSGDNVASINMISDNDYFTLSGTGVTQSSANSLNVDKKVGNNFLLTAKSGYQIKSICFYGKIEDASVYKTTDGSDWTGTISSTNTSGDAHYTFSNINATHFGVKLSGTKGIWIRNMVITIAPAAAACGATQPGTISKGTLSGCTMRLTASGSPASNNTWYWQASSTGTSTSESGATKDVTTPGTYYIRSFCSDGSDCWSDAVQVTITAADMTPAAPTALAKSSVKAKGVTLTVTDAANTNDYEFYVNTSSSAPSAGTSASYTSTSKSVTITDKYAGTTFYAWARAKCGSNKSAWTALTGNTFTTSTVTVTHTLTNVTKTSGATTAGGSDYTAEFAAVSGYSMPTPTVTIDGNTATSGTDYTWSSGTLTIPANRINGNIVITLNSVPSAPSSAAISGTYHYFPGDNISLTCTPSGNNGPTTYQWYKGGKADGNMIDCATSATYTKNSCAFADAGSYYCKVTCNATSIWAESGNSYDVKILRLYVNGSKSGEAYGNVDFEKVNSTTATASISLGSNWTYGFNIADGCGHYYGNAGTMTENNCGPWVTNVNGTDCGLTTTNAATYIFTINYSNLSMITTTVTFPVANQAAGKVIYFDNNVLKWTGSSIYYRIGHSSHSQADQLSLVPGTENLYKMTTREYNGFFAWQIGNAEGGNGSGKSIYNTKNTPAITASIAYEGASVTADAVTVTPGVDHSPGGDAQNNNCEFYNYTITDGMKTDRVTITEPSNGTITVNYTNTSNVASTLTSGYADLAHTVILTSITATPNTGYDAGAITINGGPYSANYVVTGATTIAATFSPHVYTITLNNGEHGAANQSATVAYLAGELTSITHVTPNTGYTLTGYYDGKTKVLNANGTFASANVTGYITDSKWTKTSDATLTAKWECVSLTVILGGDAATPAGGSPIGTEYTLTCSASTGVIASYQWKQNTTASTEGAVNAVGTGATSASFSPNPAAAGTYYYYCVATDACGNSVNTSYSGVFQFNEPVDPCSEPAEVTNEIARFFVPCGTSTAAAWNTTADASTGDNSFTTSGFGGNGTNWYRNETSGLIYGKLTGSGSYILLELKSGNFQAGDVVTAYFNRNNATKTGLTLKTQGSSYAITPANTAAGVETSGSYTLEAGAIEDDGSIKFFRAESSTYVNRIIVTRPPVAATITATKTSPDYVTTDPNNLVLSISTTGASSGWYYRVKNTGTSGYQTPDNTPYNTATWTMTSGLVLGANNFVVELYDGSHIKQAESATITVTAETAYPMTIAAGAGGSVSPSGEIKANESGNHIHPEITATPSSGYHFVNWTLNNANATLANASSATTTITNASGACTITANFEADVVGHTVTYNYNGATSGASPTSATGASVTLPTPTRTGYEFDGWYTTAGEKVGAGGATYEPGADITLYARWEEECDAGGVAKSTADVPATGYTTYIEKGGDKVAFTAAPTLGFKYKDAAGNTINNSTTGVVRNNAYKCQISSDSGNKGSIKTNSTFSNVDSISFYFAASDKSGCKIAVWCSTDNFSADSTQLLSATTYADNNSEFKLKTLAIPSGKKASALRFKFRFTVTSSGKTSYIDSLKVYSSTSGGGTCYHVYYHGNGAESGFVSDTTSYADGAKATVLSYNDSHYPLTKDGYDFQGWATSAGGSAVYSDGQKITIDGADVDLYAKWATASTALVTWTMNTNTSTWGASATSTTDGTNIGSIATARTAGSNGTREGATAKVTMATAEVTGSAAPSNSANFTFTIGATKQVEISKFDCKVFNVNSGNRTYKAQISDAAGNVYNSTNTVAVSTEATLTDASFVFGSGKILRGDVTIRIYAWKTSGSPTEFRMGPDVKFYGTVDDYACATPSAPTISGVSEYVPGQTITLTATHEGENYDNLTTYTWYKGDTWGGKSQVQAAATGSAGYTFTKASCAAGDAGKYWCEVANGTCNAHNSEGYNIIVYPTYTITYNLDGGTNPVDPAPKTSYTQFDEDYTLPVPTKADAIFAGWYEASDFSGVPAVILESGSVGDKQYWAKWGTAVTATWTITKVDDALYRGGSGYKVTAVIDQAAWDNSFKDGLELTATEGVTLKNIEKDEYTSGPNDGKTYVTADFDITTVVPANATQITFTLSVPADGTYAPAELTHDEDLTDCSGGVVEVRFLSSEKNDAGENFADMENGSSQLVGNGIAQMIATNTAGLNDANNKIGYRADRANIVFKLTTTSDLDIYFNANATGKSITLYSFSSAKELNAIETSDYSSKTKVTSVTAVGATFASSSHSASAGVASVSSGVVNITTAGGIKATYASLAAGYYVLIGSGEGYFYGFDVDGGAGGGGPVTPTLTWTPALNTDEDWKNSRLEKETGDVDFTFVAGQDKNSLGTITYSSNNTAVATVNAAGTVHIVGAQGDATITATLAESGCFEEATATYNIHVEDNCIDEPGTISTTDEGCGSIRMTVSGHTTSGETVSYQWYKVGSPDTQVGTNSDTYTTSTAGEYYVVVTNTGTDHCAMASKNTITIKAAELMSATKIVDQWYVKKDRRTPDVELVQTKGATGFTVKIGEETIWDEANSITTGFAGCGFHMGENGIIYLNGTKDNGDAPAHDDGTWAAGDVTLKITANNGCGNSASELSITIHKQAKTDRPSIAFVVDGTKDGAWNAVTSGHASGTDLYDYLNYNESTNPTGAFDLTERNIYHTTNEKDIREEYSQYDAILITDDPSTNTTPSGDYKTKGYVNAFGTMVDVRPILTMEAYVSALANWKAKGIAGNPSSPNPRQYEIRLECKDHEIYKSGLPEALDGSNVWDEVIGDDIFRHVIVVDSTKGIYNGVAYNVETAGDKKPALQGFNGSAAGSLLGLGRILDGTLQAAIERQEEPAARLLVMGVNAKALRPTSALTTEGKIVIRNILTYLLKTNMEEVDDCSNYFTGATDDDWNKATNWSKGGLPSNEAKVRILAPCVVKNGNTFHVAQVDIATRGTSSKKGSGAANGNLTIEAGGALIVTGKIRAAEAPYFTANDLKPTTVNDLIINTNGSGQAALIFDNEEGDTKATVNLYSLGRKEGGAYQFQYFAVPMEYVDVNPAFAGSGIYTYVWHENGGWERRGYYTGLSAFEGVGITTKFNEASHNYTMTGNLASTAEKEITLTKGADGDNIIGNSWMAPINIASLRTGLVDDANIVDKTVYIYCAGNDKADGDDDVDNSSTETPGQWLAIPIDASGWGGWDGLKVIPAMQAFLIHANAETTLTLNYKDHVRSTATANLNEKLRAPGRRTAHQQNEFMGMRMRVTDSQTHTDLYLFEGERFSDYYDNGWEAKFMSGDGRSAQFYAMNGDEKMAVLATNDLEGTPVCFTPGNESNYTISFFGDENGYYLNDIKLQNSVRISEGETYTFTYEEGDAANRFYISRTPIDAPQTSTGVDNTGSGEVKARKFIYRDKMYILINGRVYSADGALVK